MTLVDPDVRARHAAASTAEVLVDLAGRLAAASAGRPGLASVGATIPGPDPVALHAAGRRLDLAPAIWLQPDRRFALVAIGAAWTVRASGPGRFRDVAAAWQELLRGAAIEDPGLARGAGPILIGGFGFAAAPSTSPTWRGFEAARFVLPELLVTMTPDGTRVTASSVGVADPAGRDPAEVADRWTELFAAADAIDRTAGAGGAESAPGDDGRPGSVQGPRRLELVREEPGEADWRATVARLTGAVGRGRLDKVVLARRVDLRAAGPIGVPAVLRRLAASAPESTVFAVDRGRRTFLGATPERLVSTLGREFRTVAMAGSIGRGANEADDDRLAAELAASEKEREEHRIVVEMLRDALAPLAERLDIAPEPSVVRLRHIQHLSTVVDGRLRAPGELLALVERLHPTPAVGGAPRDLALDLIDEQEGLDRGWYAGPVGWLDRNGDGEFVVAIRSGVVEGRTASLFAGCGIVADSDPGSEWGESTIKLRALASALGEVGP